MLGSAVKWKHHTLMCVCVCVCVCVCACVRACVRAFVRVCKSKLCIFFVPGSYREFTHVGHNTQATTYHMHPIQLVFVTDVDVSKNL